MVATMGRARLVGGLLVFGSLLSAGLCYVVFAIWLPSDMERYREYTGAEPCPARGAVEWWEDCLRTVSFTVEDTEIEDDGLRNSTFAATLSGAPFWNGVVGFGDPGPLLERLGAGDEVTGTVWRGDVVAISRGGTRQSSSEAPRDEPQAIAAIGTAAGLLAAAGLVFGAVRLARPGEHGAFTWRPYGMLLLVTIGLICAAVGAAALVLGLSWWVVPTVAVPAVAYVARELHRYQFRRRPAGEETVTQPA